jgi:glycosyltransferase involved in cell wall biosynthesis
MPFFSLIIPVYNVDPYLCECLDSCINQTFKNLEIICINDCSTDNSKLILEKYAKKDNRIKVINHDINKGLGAARNTGINAACGDYCWFIDSDDYILLNACELLNDIISQIKVDIIRFQRIDYKYDIRNNEKSILPQTQYSWINNTLYSKNDFLKLDMPEVSSCMFIASTALLKTVKFRESVLHEDTDFTPMLFSLANNIYVSNLSLYCVRHRLGSITDGGIGEISEKRIIDILAAIDALYIFVTSKTLPKKHFCVRTAVKLCSFIKPYYNKCPNIHTKDRNEIFKKIEKLGSVFSGDINLYNNIIFDYGNKWLLEFILRVYRFVIKKINR